MERASFSDGPEPPSALRAAIASAHRRPEPEALPPLLEEATMPPDMAARTQALAHRLAERLRGRKGESGRAGLVQGLLQEYALSSEEGVALMCLAEALLRIPDAATRDALIRDKIAKGRWRIHAGRSPSVFVNAATWGLLLTGKLVATHSESALAATLGRILLRGGEPLVRKGVDMAMRMMGEQFVTGESIGLALRHARPLEARGFRYSYDMLGEAALTAHDAARYLEAYREAIHAIGRASAGRGVHEGPGISIKLSALHPRYVRAQRKRVLAELYPVLLELALLACGYGIGLNIDAEEADRLELSLELLETLCFEDRLAGWQGIGFVVQAYQKRCPFVVDHLVDLARRSGHRLMVRLVKGAYWDSEIKRAQIDGLDGYPVYTRKVHTDVAYLACARRLLAAADAVYPQFATHNAHTLAAIHAWADPDRYWVGQYEFQCLHGMGEPLYEQVVGSPAEGRLDRPCRIYAPVGTHETLLAYLVRRLLENGANTSFVNRIADPSVPLDALVRDPVEAVRALAAAEGGIGRPHPAIPLPRDLQAPERANSRGLDLSDEPVLRRLDAALAERASPWEAEPMPAPDGAPPGAWRTVVNPADPADAVGRVRDATEAEVDLALARSQAFAPAWAATPPAVRAAALDAAADGLEQAVPRLLGLLMREAGKTAANAVAEVREAVDFLRFYAAQGRRDLSPGNHDPLGPVVCISPWNFPLAIFTGQVAAALAAGNTVLAKPAEQTPLVAAEAVRCLREAGVPADALQLLPGPGEVVGARLVADPRTMGVLFTGSTDVARILQRALAPRTDRRGDAIALVAETGGQNAMVVDSSALVEQAVGDILASAFDSAGQRCSALRVLCVQDDVADRLLAMLRGAMAELRVGDPGRLAVDVGPVIDADAKAAIDAHVERMRARGRPVVQACHGSSTTAGGTFVVPTLIELDDLSELRREIFGPVLHVVRFRRDGLDALLEQIDATGYGLTLGLHTRIDETIGQVVAAAHAGNVYVNRNMVGAVVGVQPFGGEGLSGTGPKAGGPLYLHRLLARRPDGVLGRALRGEGDGLPDRAAPAGPLQDLHRWALDASDAALAAACVRFAEAVPAVGSRTLRGPTGERNVYSLVPRDAVLCVAADPGDRRLQLAAVLAVGSRAVWPAAAAAERARLPLSVQERIVLAEDVASPAVAFDAVVVHGTADDVRATSAMLAARAGPIVGLQRVEPGSDAVALERLVVERSLSVNTAAAGGNASLMAVG